MRLLVQRVKEASVTIGGVLRSRIGKGLLVLVGVGHDDGEEDLEYLAGKLVRLRIFDDEQGVMNLDVVQTGGEVLVVSQFTLMASTRKGNRPSYVKAAPEAVSRPLYERFAARVGELTGRPVATGEFGADMQVALINDGPVTIWIDSKNKETSMKTKTIAWMAGCLVACLVACGGDDSKDFSGTSGPDPEQPPVFERYDLSVHTGWAELPAVDNDSEDLYYAAHFCNGLPGGRNYSICYSAENRITFWSAFPLHECYKGDQSRSDAWDYDPELPQSIQPALTKGSYQPQPGYSKGHLLASSDRTVSYAANVQTFYVTNVAPQWQNGFNSGVWKSLEEDCWKNLNKDTLYVVSGVHGVHATDEVTDKSGRKCTVPSHFFRVLLRAKAGNTGRKVQDLSADELQCVGFWFENKAYSSGKPSQNMTSVADIEQKTGMTFFVNVPNAPKAIFDKTAWEFR